jgi:hypothetical protein
MRRLAVATAAVGVLVPVGAGTAAACNGGHSNDQAAATAFAHHENVGGLFAAAQSYLGLSSDTLEADLKSGQTLAQIADATSGKSSAGLVDALNAAAKAKLDPLVAAGKLSSDQETAILAKVATSVNQLVSMSWKASDHDALKDAAFQHVSKHGGWHHHHHH